MGLVRDQRFPNDSGQGLVEYAVILALTSLGMVLALLLLRNTIGNSVQGTGHKLEAAVPSAGAPAAITGSNGGGNGNGNSGNGKGNGGASGN